MLWYIQDVQPFVFQSSDGCMRTCEREVPQELHLLADDLRLRNPVKLQQAGTAEELKNNPVLERAYLGVD